MSKIGVKGIDGVTGIEEDERHQVHPLPETRIESPGSVAKPTVDRGRLPDLPAPSLVSSASWLKLTWISILMIALTVTWFWSVDPVGRDPVMGTPQPDFRTSPHVVRTLFEPLMGPALQVGREPSLRQFCILASYWMGAVLVLLGLGALKGSRSCSRALVVCLSLTFGWSFLVLSGFGIPDRFVAVGRRGVFVDWHLHGGDPRDGRISVGALERRQRQRGVSWAVMTPHSAEVPISDASLAHGVQGTEWSGPAPDSVGALHILILGTAQAVVDANAKRTEIDAIRAAKAAGALVIVAHYWRTAFDGPPAPSVESLVAAGADGFEVGNRHREDDPWELAHLLDLDRRISNLPLLRLSFSDDHGYPAGSPSVTFLENVTSEDLESRGAAVLASLRHDASRQEEALPVRAVPLIFDHAAPGRSVPAFLVPPVVLLDYLRGLTPPARLSWLVYGITAIVWIVVPFPRRKAAPAGRYRPGGSRGRSEILWPHFKPAP